MALVCRAAESGERLVGSDLEDAAWAALVAGVRSGTRGLRMECCGGAGRPRVSSLGTRHFYHPRHPDGRVCPGAGESPQHLLLKVRLLQILREQGWTAEPEVAGEGWRADVLAERDGVRVAWEVQLSPQDAVTTQQRQRRYAQAGLRCVWLMKRPPADLPSSAQCPIFGLVQHDDDWQVSIPRPGTPRSGWHQLPLQQLVQRLCSRQLRYTTGAEPRASVDLAYLEISCRRCEAALPVLAAYGLSRCACGFFGGMAYTETVGQALAELAPQLPLPRPVRLEQRGQAWVNVCACGQALLPQTLRDTGYWFGLRACRQGHMPAAQGEGWRYLGWWTLPVCRLPELTHAGSRAAPHWCPIDGPPPRPTRCSPEQHPLSAVGSSVCR